MRFFILIKDENDFVSCIDVYGAVEYTDRILLERLPWQKRDEVFETAIALACRLRTAGFDVYVERR